MFFHNNRSLIRNLINLLQSVVLCNSRGVLIEVLAVQFIAFNGLYGEFYGRGIAMTNFGIDNRDSGVLFGINLLYAIVFSCLLYFV